MVRVEPPQRGVIHVHGAKLGKPRVVHLKQSLLDARVNTGGDEALDLHALACKGCARRHTVTIVESDAAGVQQGWSGQVAYGVHGSSEHVAPQEVTFGKGFIELGGVCREGGDKARELSECASQSAKVGWLGVLKAALK